ncbi:MAG TPA: DUF6348 family protein [Luteimonas sp.]|nr:DUF6348 family protein [Luteimonas sp.]
MVDDHEWELLQPLLMKSIHELQRHRQQHGTSLAAARQQGFGRAALDKYRELTGFNETNVDALWHHRVGIYGPDCVSCGKPLRTPRASFCAACGTARSQTRSRAAGGFGEVVSILRRLFGATRTPSPTTKVELLARGEAFRLYRGSEVFEGSCTRDSYRNEWSRLTLLADTIRQTAPANAPQIDPHRRAVLANEAMRLLQPKAGQTLVQVGYGINPPSPSQEVESLLASTLAKHGISFDHAQGEFTVSDGLRLTVLVHERPFEAGRHSVVLEVLAEGQALEGGTISECFAGVAEAQSGAIKESYGKFLLSTFHVLIDALSVRRCDDCQSEIEYWTGNRGDWTLYSGPLLSQHSGKSLLTDAYSQLLPKLQILFEQTQPSGPHWIRIFVASYDGKIQASEVLLDNEPWPEALELVNSQSWQPSHEYQSIRHFMIALPNGATHPAPTGFTAQ